MLDCSHLPVGLVKLSVEGEGQTLPSTPALDQYLKAGGSTFLHTLLQLLISLPVSSFFSTGSMEHKRPHKQV